MKDDSSTAVLEPPSTATVAAPSAPSELAIEPASWDDMRTVVEIVRSSATWYEDIVEPEDLAEHYVDLDWARQNFSRREFFVGKINDDIAGTVSLQEVGDDHLYLGYVYLHVDHVGNGFGGDLLDFARDQGRERGRKSLILLAHPEAEWACRAYQKYGFRVIADRREKILSWEDGWLEPYYEEGFHLFQYSL